MGSKGPVAALCLLALMGSLFILDSRGFFSQNTSLRGRRLQVGQIASNLHGQVHQGISDGVQYGGQLAQQGMAQGSQLANQGLGYGQEALEHGKRFAGNMGTVYDHVQESPLTKLRNGIVYTPQYLVQNFLPAPLLVLQVIFAVIYFFTVVSNYPYWRGPTPKSCQLQNEPAPCATTNTSPVNCFLSYCCPQARAAHTFDRTGTLEYWCGLIAMFFCPFCTLCWANACTDLNPKLGGEQANIISSAVCTWCCPCCVIAQDAESLDAATMSNTGLCGVSGGGPVAHPMHHGMHHGMHGGMHPHQQSMYPRF